MLQEKKGMGGSLSHPEGPQAVGLPANGTDAFLLRGSRWGRRGAPKARIQV